MSDVLRLRLSESERSVLPTVEEYIRGGNKPIVKVQTVSPEQCREILRTTNVHNRPLRPQSVARYAQEMRDNRWNEATPVFIVFALIKSAWVLLDGQNRLEAAIAAGNPIQFHFYFGAPADTQKFMDIGRRRTIGDVLKLTSDDLGVNATSKFVGEAAQRTWTGASTSEARLAVSELVDFIKAPEIHSSIKFVMERAIPARVKNYTYAAAVAAFVRADINYRRYKSPAGPYTNKEDFRARLILAGSGLSKGRYESYKDSTDSAILTLRDKLNKEFSGKSMGNAECARAYLLTCAALDNFLKLKGRERLDAAKDDPYPLPEAFRENFRSSIQVVELATLSAKKVVPAPPTSSV